MAQTQTPDVEDSEFFHRTVIFKAESTLFSIPMAYLPTGGGVFESMFSLPNVRGEGKSKEDPIILTWDVTASDFRSFMKVCLPQPHSLKAYSMSVSDWMSVLKLSTMWCLDELRARAIEGADTQVKAMPDVVEKILLARRYSVSRWLIDGYEALGKRSAYLSPDEQSKLGLETAVNLAELRERSWSWYAAKLKDEAVELLGQPARHSSYPFPVARWAFSNISRGDFDYVGSIRVIFLSELSLDRDYLSEQYAPFTA
ncbi:unnamed protein product [Peniophora sp. CBMAI 1063]|nr:unnamed protein product [Peniophora sp. CBMAI 1063]